jgi:hypothetical protein
LKAATETYGLGFSGRTWEWWNVSIIGRTEPRKSAVISFAIATGRKLRVLCCTGCGSKPESIPTLPDANMDPRRGFRTIESDECLRRPVLRSIHHILLISRSHWQEN